MTNNITERQKPRENASDTRIKSFWAALSRYHAAQASIYAVMADDESPGKVLDENMGNAIDALHEATCDVLNAPSRTSILRDSCASPISTLRSLGITSCCAM